MNFTNEIDCSYYVDVCFQSSIGKHFAILGLPNLCFN
jgi:hypothetical protein